MGDRRKVVITTSFGDGLDKPRYGIVQESFYDQIDEYEDWLTLVPAFVTTRTDASIRFVLDVEEAELSASPRRRPRWAMPHATGLGVPLRFRKLRRQNRRLRVDLRRLEVERDEELRWLFNAGVERHAGNGPRMRRGIVYLPLIYLPPASRDERLAGLESKANTPESRENEKQDEPENIIPIQVRIEDGIPLFDNIFCYDDPNVRALRAEGLYPSPMFWVKSSHIEFCLDFHHSPHTQEVIGFLLPSFYGVTHRRGILGSGPDEVPPVPQGFVGAFQTEGVFRIFWMKEISSEGQISGFLLPGGPIVASRVEPETLFDPTVLHSPPQDSDPDRGF